MKSNKVVVLLNAPSSGLWPPFPSRGEGNGVRGFTLIELLVVVLIIGILAAVALPQYQKAVEKSRATEALTLLKSLYSASKVYYLEHGQWPSQISQLSIDIPWMGNQAWYAVGTYRAGISNKDWAIQFINNGGSNWGVSIGRISGAYAGTAFEIYLSSSNEQIPLEYILCAEGPSREHVLNKFNKSKGAYCQQLFHATELPVISAGMDYFLMP